MAAARTLLLALLLLLPLPEPPGRVRGQESPGRGRRLSEFKRCADAECSMLMARGEALGDFTGPDCRFVNFKKGDPVFVYYKLAGVLPEVWAGSVGRIFGYFPKDLIRVDYEYSKEELQVPADETDFVCFDGGRDEFDSYNVEELLGFLELYDSSVEDSAENSVEEAPLSGEESPGAATGHGPVPGPADSNAGGGASHSVRTQDFVEPAPPSERQPPADADTGPATVTGAELPPSEALEETLQEKPKVPEIENRTSSRSQASSEQKKMDAYKLLKKEMTLDLKTKFGSTADAMVSDDETTTLVTSLEDDYSEALDSVSYVMEEEEANESDLDELPLLTFTGPEEPGPPEGPEQEKPSAERAQDLKEAGKLPPSVRAGNKNILGAWGGTLLSIVTEGDGGTVPSHLPDLEGSDSEEKEDDGSAGPESTQRKPQTPANSFDPETTSDFFVEVFKTNDENNPGADTEPPSKEKDRGLEEPKAALVQDEPQSVATQDSPQLAAGKDRDPLPPALEHEDSDPQEAAGAGLWEKSEEEVPTPGGNLFWLQLRDAATTLGHRLSKETEAAADSAQPQAEQGADETEEREQPDGTAAPGSHAEEAEADEEEEKGEDEEERKEEEEAEDEEEGEVIPELLLEDENAVSAKQSQEICQASGDGKPVVSPQGSEEAHLGTKENQQEPNVTFVIEKENATAMREAGRPGRGPGHEEVGEEDRSPPAQPEDRAQAVSESSGPMGQDRTPWPRAGEALGKKDPGGDSSGPSGELPEEADKARGMGSPELAPGDPRDHLSQQSPHSGLEAGLGAGQEDWPIIRSFFKEQQSLGRLLKYLDAGALEAMLQDLSFRLKAARQESPPYAEDKVLDRVFQASESQILSMAEEMLDARVKENREKGLQESNVLEEYTVLDDVQDLIYFVRYKHLAEEVQLTTVPALEEGWSGPAQEMQLPRSDDFPQETEEGPSSQPSEKPRNPWSQPVTRHAGAPEVVQSPGAQEDEAPGVIMTEVSGAEPGRAEKQPAEVSREEPSYLESVVLMLHWFLPCVSKVLVATLPEDAQPGPDFYGLPWEPVLLTACLGIVSFAIFFWRNVLAVKERIYQVTEQQIAEKVKTTTKDNAELAEKLSSYEQKIKESKRLIQEAKKQNMILSDEAIKYKDKIKVFEKSNELLDDKAKTLHVTLESERKRNMENQDLILENQKSLEKLKEVISMNASEFSEVQVALNEAKLREEKVKSECHQVQKKKKMQLQQEVEDQKKLHAELSERIRTLEKSQMDLEATLTDKDDSIGALTNCIMQLNQLESGTESEGPGPGRCEPGELANGEVGGEESKLKTRMHQLMDVSRTRTAISVLQKDLKLLQVKLRASLSAKCDLEDQIKKLDEDCGTLQAAKAGLEEECRTLQQKVEILNELYQQKEMELQKKLSQEEFEQQQRDQRLSAADEKVVLATEEVKVYKQRIHEMEEELQKTERSFKNQLATHEKKAHENWLKARNAERLIAEEKRQAVNLRQRLVEMTQKLAMFQEEPVIIKPMPDWPGVQNAPHRGPLSQNGSFGQSPVSGGECSPPPGAEPPGRPPSASLNFARRDIPRADFDPGPGPVANSSSRGSSPAKDMDDGKVSMAAKGPPAYPGPPFLGGPMPPLVGYGPPPPPPLCRPFGPRPMPPRPPPPFVPCMGPPLGLREYAPGILPGRRDLPLHPREFLPGPVPFRPPGPLGPREYFIPAPRMPPPPSGPQDYPPPPAGPQDYTPPPATEEPQVSGPREAPASSTSSQEPAQALRQSP
uniref:Transport and Golgi organization protein 1 homolog n=1 Tax=Cavia porcellus TaxID=10141 RepID=H0VB24_CAVPO|nr:transport and Golgi organization protein 1 homolog isoform X2 [Cavia porcellus]